MDTNQQSAKGRTGASPVPFGASPNDQRPTSPPSTPAQPACDGDYTAARDKLFEKETVDTLYDKIVAQENELMKQ